jgi:RNA polymerase sigma-70 factor (ECF subfamily)
MKRSGTGAHSPDVVPHAVTPVDLTLESVTPALTVTDIYEAHADFVWSSLHRLGVRDADVADMTQEVFVVVHRRLGSWDKKSRITSWLFGISMKVAAGYRRRAWFRRERPVEVVEETTAETPESEAALADARRRLRTVLDALSPERRATFVMFEIEGRSCAEIAELFGVPVGTVHSRLHAARRDFEESAARHRAREGRRQ